MPTMNRLWNSGGWFSSEVFKVIEKDKRGLRVWERIEEIERSNEGDVVRVMVVRIECIDEDTPRLSDRYKYTYREYTSKSWITRTLREYAHIAAKAYTPVMM